MKNKIKIIPIHPNLVDDSKPRDSTSKFDTPSRIFAALFYGLVSIAIMLLNKHILTLQHFPSPHVLGLGQMFATIFVIKILNVFSVIQFPALSKDILEKMFPLPLFYLANMLFGLVVTQELSLPMITVLRRFSILFTMVLQYLLLKSHFNFPVLVSVFFMMFGALIAASHDLSFNMFGYVIIMLNNLSTALNSVITKKKLNNREIGPYGLAYYNSLFMIIPMIILCLITRSFELVLGFSALYDPFFICQYVCSCFLGFLLIFSSNLCTQINSPLDTNVIGCLKNIIVTYIGMIFGGDYIFSWINFVGVNISILGSLIYSYISFFNIKKNIFIKKSECILNDCQKI
uniref:Sugar phosphate transporter domain-containing protein n=1 Tax=Lepeophtheirus salmonis TaxID=72036 RepID=A0A0K2TT52_LEPSM